MPGIVISSTLFFPKIATAIQGNLCFHIHFRNACFTSVKYDISISKWIALNVYIALVSMAILMMLILPIHEYGTCFYLFVSSLIFFFSVVQFSVYRSFTSLVRFIPRYIIFLVAIARGIFSVISDFDISLLVYKNAFDF